MAFGVAAVLQAVEQLGVATGADFGVAELAGVAGFHLAAQGLRHPLHAVADAQHRHAQAKQRRVGLVVGFVHRVGAAREDDRLGVKGADGVDGHVVGVQFAIDMRLAHAAGNQLRHLRAKVENEDFVHGALSGGRRVRGQFSRG